MTSLFPFQKSKLPEVPEYIPDDLKEAYLNAFDLYVRKLPQRAKKLSTEELQHETVLIMVQMLDSKKDQQRAWKIFDEQTYLRAQAGYLEAQKEWARRNMVGQVSGRVGKPDYLEAEKWYKRAAERGDAESYFWLADMYRRGNKTIKKDLETAKQYYQKAAELGHKDALVELDELSQ